MSDKKGSKSKVNMLMADEMIDWYQNMADEMGIPRSTAMVIALKTYQDQQEMLKLTKFATKE